MRGGRPGRVGQARTHEWTGKFDGADYPVTGDPTTDTRSLKMVSAGHYTITNDKSGKPVITGTVEFSTDNKTRTLTSHMTDPADKKLTSVSVFDRQ